jgi:predicted N-acetyltransferase YhbS
VAGLTDRRWPLRAESVDGRPVTGDAGPVSRPLTGGLELRTARPTDLDRIAALLTDRGEPADAVDHRLIVGDPDAGWDWCAVVADGPTVAATAMLLDETLVLDGLAIPAGQVELVATAREYEGRGLARALMAWAHERSARRGQLAQVMLGIPYFYRRFGYQYAVDLPQARSLLMAPTRLDHYTVRRAGPADIAAMARLQEAAQRGYDLTMAHSPAGWRWLVARTGSSHLVVELGEVAAVEPEAAHALAAHVVAQGDGGCTVMERPGSLGGDALEGFLAPRSRQAASYYLRVPDPRALLDHMRPVLSDRLAAATGLARDGGEAIVSFFRHHVRLVYEKRAVVEVQAGGRMQAPASAGGAGVAPDLVAPLLFGPHGIVGLAERHPDVYPGPDEALMAALFPPVRADLLTIYLP